MGERLTERTGSGLAYVGRHTKLRGIDGPSSMRVAAIRDVMERLEEYENTGMTPEQIVNMQGRVHLAAMEMLESIKELPPHLPEITQAAIDRLTPEQFAKIAQAVLRKN